jgi:hypothetical protein
MANGTYGIVKPSFVDPSEVEVWYYYRPTRSSEDSNFSTGFKRLDNTYNVFETTQMGSTDLPDNVLPGMYNLRLPVDVFGQKGFYTIYLKPKEILCTIQDVGVLSAYPDIKGIILNMEDTNLQQFRSILENGMLTGYRIEYFGTNSDNQKRQPYYRIVTSNNKVEPVVQNLSDSNQKANRYRYNDSSNLTFLTVTPSTAMDFKSNAVPYIGVTGQQIALVNTKFNPQMIEIEMVNHDIETLTYMVEGNQIRALDKGLITTYNENNEIYNQTQNYTLKSRTTGNPVYEVKENKIDNIDFTQDFDTIVQE